MKKMNPSLRNQRQHQLQNVVGEQHEEVLKVVGEEAEEEELLKRKQGKVLKLLQEEVEMLI